MTVIGTTLAPGALGAVTVSVVVPEIFPERAVIVVVPAATGVALPLLPAVLLMVATDEAVELQVTDAVIFWVELLENVPVAVNCSVVPKATLGFAGVTAMETNVAAVTVRVVEAEMVPDTAVIVVVPAATGVAMPVLLTVATDEAVELQVTDVVIFWFELFENVPVAVNC